MNSTNANIKHVCFDLDGTLIESRITIYKTTVKALREVGVNDPVPEKEFNSMIGMHFIDMFKNMNIELKEFEEFIGIYKNYYFDFIDDSVLYPGVVDALSFINNGRDIKVSLLTTKGQDQAEKIIKHFKLDNYFNFIMGRRDGIAHKPSAEPLLFICNQIGIDAKDTVIVGDTELDINCGKNAGAVTCGVTYGYRTKESLKENSPDFLIDNLRELQTVLKNSSH